MKLSLFALLISVLFVSCKDSFDDSSKRNENYVWWVDAKTGKARWVKIGDNGEQVQTGRYTLFYSNGQVYEKGRRINRKDADTIFSYGRDGKVFKYAFVKTDTTIYYFIKNGPITIYQQTGKLSDSGVIENHKAGDQWIHYYPDGKVNWKRNRKNGIGWNVSYYESGSVSDSDYNDGKFFRNVKHWTMLGRLERKFKLKGSANTGIQFDYYDNGQLKASTSIVNDKHDGKLINWYPNGKIKAVGEYKNGLKSGHCFQYYESGKIYADVNCIDDLPDGHGLLYFENGKIKIDRYFKKGQPDGEAKEFNETGKLIRDNIYKEGELVEDKLKSKPLLIP